MPDELMKYYIQDSHKLNELYKKYDKELANFYDGGYSFEDCNGTLIAQIEALEQSVRSKLIEIVRG